MVLTDLDINDIVIDMDDDWQSPNVGGPASVAIFSDMLTERACRWFNVDLFHDYMNGWVDKYAILNVAEERVERIYISLCANDSAYNGPDELNLLLYPSEGRALYKHLYENGGDSYHSYIEECKEEVWR